MYNAVRVFLTSLLFFSALTNAQTCSDVLGSVKEKSFSDYSSVSLSTYESNFCDRSFESESDLKDFSSSIGIPIEGLPMPIEATGDASAESFSQRHEEFCQSLKKKDFNLTKYKSAIEKINEAVVKAWQDCINNTDGPMAWAEYDTCRPEQVSFMVKYRARAGDEFATQPLTVAFDSDDQTLASACELKCKNRLPKKVGAGGRSCTCKISQNNTLTATFTVGDEDRIVAVPPKEALLAKPKTTETQSTLPVNESMIIDHEGGETYEFLSSGAIAGASKNFKSTILASPKANGEKMRITVRVPNGASSFSVNVGYQTSGSCSRNTGEVPHGVNLALQTSSGNSRSGNSKYGAAPQLMSIPLTSSDKEVTLVTSTSVPNNRWCANILWAEPRFEVIRRTQIATQCQKN